MQNDKDNPSNTVGNGTVQAFSMPKDTATDSPIPNAPKPNAALTVFDILRIEQLKKHHQNATYQTEPKTDSPALSKTPLAKPLRADTNKDNAGIDTPQNKNRVFDILRAEADFSASHKADFDTEHNVAVAEGASAAHSVMVTDSYTAPVPPPVPAPQDTAAAYPAYYPNQRTISGWRAWVLGGVLRYKTTLGLARFKRAVVWWLVVLLVVAVGWGVYAYTPLLVAWYPPLELFLVSYAHGVHSAKAALSAAVAAVVSAVVVVFWLVWGWGIAGVAQIKQAYAAMQFALVSGYEAFYAMLVWWQGEIARNVPEIYGQLSQAWHNALAFVQGAWRDIMN